MTNQAPPRIMLALGWREILVSSSTMFVRATLDRILPELLMPDPTVNDHMAKALEDMKASASTSSWGTDYEAAEVERERWRGVYDEQQFLRRQVLDFAFVTLFHMLERRLQKFLRDADRLYGGAILNGTRQSLDFNAMLGVLARCGYDTNERPFRHNLRKLNVISNVVKHGHGSSLTRIAQEFPGICIRKELDEEMTPEHLVLTPELLSELGTSVAAFWESFPAEQFI